MSTGDIAISEHKEKEIWEIKERAEREVREKSRRGKPYREASTRCGKWRPSDPSEN